MGALYTENGNCSREQRLHHRQEGHPGLLEGRHGHGDQERKLETIELDEHGNSAYEVGKYTLSGAGGQVLDQGKYIVIWKKQHGEWKLHRDIWTRAWRRRGASESSRRDQDGWGIRKGIVVALRLDNFRLAARPNAFEVFGVESHTRSAFNFAPP